MPDGSYRLRCMVESRRRKVERDRLKRHGLLEQPARQSWREQAAERMALEALAQQYPSLTRDELRLELLRQREAARSGALAPAGR